MSQKNKSLNQDSSKTNLWVTFTSENEEFKSLKQILAIFELVCKYHLGCPDTTHRDRTVAESKLNSCRGHFTTSITASVLALKSAVQGFKVLFFSQQLKVKYLKQEYT